MNKDTVKWFNPQKGYGFTTSEKNGMGIFVHFSGVASSGFKSLEEDQAATFDTTDSPKGFQTVNACAAQQALA